MSQALARTESGVPATRASAVTPGNDGLEDREEALAEVGALLAAQANISDAERMKYELLYARYTVILKDVKDLRRSKERINFLSLDGWRIFEMEAVNDAYTS
jgi:hypothetical protein